MTDKKLAHIDRAELRRRAEEFVTGVDSPDSQPDRAKDDTLKLVNELQVYQIELEMQNAELRQARIDMEAALEKYTNLYDFAPVGYVTLDRTGTVTAANLTCAGILGVERSRLAGRRFGRFIPAETRYLFSDFLVKVFASRAKEVCETVLLKEGGSSLFVHIEAVAAASGQECRVALTDITEHKRFEEALMLQKEATEAHRQAKETAESTDRIKSLFLANMSHELRNPMTVILAMLQLTLKEELNPVLREYQDMAQRSARSLLRILNDILDMAKIEAGKLSIEDELFSLPLCISEVVDTFTPEVQRKGLEITLSIAEDMPKTVVGDQLRLQQILTNLVGNAVKFTETGSVVVRVSSAAASSAGIRDFTFSVTDTGIGVPEAKKGLLFRAFSQIDSSHSRRYGGTGLGLSISREIVELMGGTISCSSEEGSGSTFSFTVPLREARFEGAVPSPAAPLSPEAIPAPAGERAPRILLAEDDAGNRKAFGALFKMSNYDVDFAEDGLQVIELWERGAYDLVLMDIQMPQLNGYEATRAIRLKEVERGGHIPIVALTAHAFKEDVEKCLAAGMDAYISKPIDIVKFLQLIGEIIKLSPAAITDRETIP
jgi:PAS domain S-box-containing protein